MSDRFPAQIWIGGQLSRSARLYPFTDDDTTILQGLIASLNADDASHEYGDTCIAANCTEKGLGDYLTEDGKLLNLKCDQAVNGEFPDTEQFCMEHGIAFDRWSDHYCEYDGENASWRPGMNSPTVRYADSSGNEKISAAPIREVIEQLREYLDSQEHDPEVISGVLLTLDSVCPELPPDLEVFNLFT